MGIEEVRRSCSWSWDEDKAFENALVKYTEDSNGRWENIAADVPGKTVEEIKNHYRILEEDVRAIELGLVPVPSYHDSTSEVVGQEAKNLSSCKDSSHRDGQRSSEVSKLDWKRSKRIAWTEEEHRHFLLGLEKCGKGDWRSISRDFVLTRTPTQVASHAQNFFLRLNLDSKDRKRPCVNDNISIELEDAPITSETNAPLSDSESSSQQPCEPP
ncbi:hypothetical protein HPP92_014382 [Vanilla planifolia]|uniref:Transcription factor MYBS1 n=1 Tax=Vanilla planifolia TaxID=51239 RepID=A0A835QJX1_VANPL|nr:hypothetical protein HPP92_014382 [Vanilla planifolia]